MLDESRINNARIAYGRFGPNSNSAARYMLQSLSYLVGLFGYWYDIPWVILDFGGYYAPLPGLETPAPTPPNPRPPGYHH